MSAPLPSGAVCGLSITSRRSAALRRTVAVHASQQRVGADTIVHHVIDLPSDARTHLRVSSWTCRLIVQHSSKEAAVDLIDAVEASIVGGSGIDR